MQMSAIFFVGCEKVEKGNFSACNKGNRRCVHPGNIEVAMVGKIQQIKHNYITTIYSSFRQFSQLLRNKLFIESFLIIRLHHIIFCLSFLKTFVINIPSKMCD